MTIHRNSPCDPEPILGNLTGRATHQQTWTVWATPDVSQLHVGKVGTMTTMTGVVYVARLREGDVLMRTDEGRVRRFRTVAQAARALQLASRPRVYRITLCRPTADWFPTRPCMEVLVPGAVSPAHARSLAEALLRVDRIEGRA